MQIFVLTGDTSTVEIGAAATVAELKQILAGRYGINTSEQVLTLGGHPLVDEQSLSENGVVPLSTLSLSVGLLGGTKIIVHFCAAILYDRLWLRSVIIMVLLRLDFVFF